MRIDNSKIAVIIGFSAVLRKSFLQGGMHNNGKNWENDSGTSAYTVSYPVAFPNACFTITGSPERNKNDRYAYRTGYHIIWKKESQFRYAIGTEQQGQYFEWVAIGR